MSGTIRCRRIYEEPAPDDGLRVLVERLWPRGIRKADAASGGDSPHRTI